MTSKHGAGTSNTWRRSSMRASSSGNAAWQRWHCLGNAWSTVSVGSATRLSVLPLCPTWPPTLLPDDSRRERVFFARPSDEGGLLELWLSLFTFDSSASRRASSVRMRISFSPCDRPDRSGWSRFFAMARIMNSFDAVYNCVIAIWAEQSQSSDVGDFLGRGNA